MSAFFGMIIAVVKMKIVVAVSYTHLDVYKRQALTFYAREPLQELSRLTSALDEKQTLSTAEKENIRSWLLEQNMKKEDVDTLLSALQ